MDLDRTFATLAAARRKVRAAFDRAAFRPAIDHAVVASASHAIRWRETHLRENAPVPGRRTEFIGAGGLPLWSEESISAIAAAPAAARKVVLQQDFRFGNRFLSGTSDATHIERDLMNPLGDRICKTRGDLAIDRIMDIPNTILVPWSLIGLRSSYRAGATNPTHHPVWNVEEHFGTDSAWESLFAVRGERGSAAQAVDWPDNPVDALFSDSQLHPSPFGCLWLSLVASGRRADAAMGEARAEFARIADGFASEAPQLWVLAGGAVATTLRGLRGTGIVAAVDMRLVEADGARTEGRAEAVALEREWASLASAILDARTTDLPRLRAEGRGEAAAFVETVNPLIDIGTERIPSLIGIAWLRDNHERLGALTADLRGYLSSLRSSGSG